MVAQKDMIDTNVKFGRLGERVEEYYRMLINAVFLFDRGVIGKSEYDQRLSQLQIVLDELNRDIALSRKVV